MINDQDDVFEVFLLYHGVPGRFQPVLQAAILCVESISIRTDKYNCKKDPTKTYRL